MNSNHHNYHQVLVRNFKAIGNEPIVFDFEQGLTIIKGNNGEGKSTLIDAFYYNLYGNTLSNNRDYKVNIDKIINSVNGGNLLTLVTFQHIKNGVSTEYVKVMGRKANIVMLFKLNNKINLHEIANELPINAKIESFLSKYGEMVILDVDKTQSQKRFEEDYLQINDFMFKSSRLATLNHMDFITKPETERFLTILNIFDAIWIDEYATECKAKRKELKTSMENVKENLIAERTKYEIAEENFNKTSENYTAQQELFAKLETERIILNDKKQVVVDKLDLFAKVVDCDAKIYNTNTYISNANANIEQLQQQIVSNFNNNKLNVQNKITELRNVISNVDVSVLQNKQVDIQNEINTVNSSLIDLFKQQTVFTTLSDDITKANTEFANNKAILEDMISKKAIRENELEQQKQNELGKIATCKSQIEDLQSKIMQIDATNETIETTKYDIVKLKTLIEQYDEFLSFYSSNVSVCNTCGQHISEELRNEKIDQLNKLKESNTNVLTHNVEYIKQIEENQSINTGIQKQINDLINVMNISSSSLELLSKQNFDNELENIHTKHNELINSKKNIELMIANLNSVKDFTSEINTNKTSLENLEKFKSSINVNIANYNANKNNLDVTIKELQAMGDHPILETPQIVSARENITIQTKLYNELIVERENIIKNLLELGCVYSEETKTNLNQELIQLNADINENYSLMNVYRIDIEEEKTFLDSAKKKLQVAESEYDRVHKEFTINENIINIFTNNSMKSILFSKYLNYLNNFIDTLVERLNIPFNIKFNSDFSVEVSGFGIGETLGNLSEGQKHIVNIIIFVVIRDMITSMGKYSSNVVIFDEYLDRGLDINNTDKLLDLIRYIYTDENIILITHKDFGSSEIDRKYKVTMDLHTKLELEE